MVREAPGWAKADPEISERIRKELRKEIGLMRDSDIPEDTLESAAYTALSIHPYEGSTTAEISRILSSIRLTGWPIKPYGGMSHNERLNYLVEVRSGIRAETRHRRPDLLAKIESENAKRAAEFYHY